MTERLVAFPLTALTLVSDHTLITVFIYRAETNNAAHFQPSQLCSLKRSARWAQNNTEESQKVISNQEIQTHLDTFLKKSKHSE